jgi:hypothetical protein
MWLRLQPRRIHDFIPRPFPGLSREDEKKAGKAGEEEPWTCPP